MGGMRGGGRGLEHGVVGVSVGGNTSAVISVISCSRGNKQARATDASDSACFLFCEKKTKSSDQLSPRFATQHKNTGVNSTTMKLTKRTKHTYTCMLKKRIMSPHPPPPPDPPN